MKTLIAVRLKAILRGLQKTNKPGKNSRGMRIVFSLLLIYVVCVFIGMFAMLFSQLAPLCVENGVWPYFALAGIIATFLAVIGTVFSTQNQLFNAKDNELLLSMPVRPRDILGSRVTALLLTNLLFILLVMVPAFVMYVISYGASVQLVIGVLLGTVALTLLSQGICCLLGWILHLFLGLLHNKAVASVIYLVLFLGVYFSIYSQIGKIIESLISNFAAVTVALHKWAFPYYILGMGAENPLYAVLFFVMTAALFAVVFYVLSATFRKTVTYKKTSKAKTSAKAETVVRTAENTVCHKELRRFLTCPVYLTNCGLGVLFVPVLAICSIVFRGKLLSVLAEVPEVAAYTDFFGIVIVAAMAALGGMIMITVPSVSLEGKSLWIMRSMPISARQVLRGKLLLHCRISVPVTAVSSIIIAIAFGCNPLQVVLAALASCFALVFCGIIGLMINLRFPRFDWQNEVYPCKQSIAGLLYMLFGFFVGITVFAAGIALGFLLSGTLSLAIIAVVFAALTALSYHSLMHRGAKKYDCLEA